MLRLDTADRHRVSSVLNARERMRAILSIDAPLGEYFEMGERLRTRSSLRLVDARCGYSRSKNCLGHPRILSRVSNNDITRQRCALRALRSRLHNPRYAPSRIA